MIVSMSWYFMPTEYGPNNVGPNQKVLIPRVDMNPSRNRWPFQMQRRQFPVVVSFAMTINKSQGQSLKQVGLFLPRPVFTHGQLYVALSRVKSIQRLKILLPNENSLDKATTQMLCTQKYFSNFIKCATIII